MRSVADEDVFLLDKLQPREIDHRYAGRYAGSSGSVGGVWMGHEEGGIRFSAHQPTRRSASTSEGWGRARVSLGLD
jgi:hypothetical protein